MPTAKTVIDVGGSSLTFNRTNNMTEEGAVERCVQLLEHAGECRAGRVCVDGLHCYRACRVLLHHRACSSDHCPVCRQLKPLCHLHALRCQKKDRSCNIPYCPNRRDLQCVVGSVNMIRNGTTAASAPPPSESCESADPDRSLLTQVKSADLLKCLPTENKKKVTGTRDDNLSITNLPFYHSGLKRHLSDKKLQYPNSYCKILATKKESRPESVLLWKAKVSIVPMK